MTAGAKKVRRIGIVGIRDSAEVGRMTARLCGMFKKFGIEPVVESGLGRSAGVSALAEEAERIPFVTDMVFSLGGDGTFLGAARLLSGSSTPMLGINLGGLGFLAECKVDEAGRMLEKIASGDYEVERRDMFAARIEENGSAVRGGEALNEVVVNRGRATGIIDLELHIDGSHITTFKADGIICSTPTGSTGYSLSAGGPVVYPTLPLAVVTPICPHTLANRPLVVSNEREIRFRCPPEAGDENLNATLDGQTNLPVDHGQEVVVTKSESSVNLVKSPFMDYFSILKTKLMWTARSGKPDPGE